MLDTIKALYETIEALERYSKAIRDEIDNNELLGAMRTLQEENEILTKANTRLHEENEELTQNNEELTERVEELESDHENIKDKLKDITDLVDDIEWML